jgi:hypothetical protein
MPLVSRLSLQTHERQEEKQHDRVLNSHIKYIMCNVY